MALPGIGQKPLPGRWRDSGAIRMEAPSDMGVVIKKIDGPAASKYMRPEFKLPFWEGIGYR